MKFNSKICTTREQSERLLSLGLKKETADMVWTHAYYSTWAATAKENPLYFHEADEDTIPAWSLSRLLCMLSSVIPLGEEFPSFGDYAFLRLYTVAVSYEYEDYDGDERIVVSFNGNGFFSAVVDCIEWLIKKGYFQKEYLVDQEAIEEHCKGVMEYLDYIRGEEE